MQVINIFAGKKFFGRSHIREVAEKRLKPINEYCEVSLTLFFRFHFSEFSFLVTLVYQNLHCVREKVKIPFTFKCLTKDVTYKYIICGALIIWIQ